jgi:hypothetical protein
MINGRRQRFLLNADEHYKKSEIVSRPLKNGSRLLSINPNPPKVREVKESIFNFW